MDIRRHLPVALVAAIVAACTSFSVLQEELPKYKGKPVDALVERLGFPSAEQTIMGKKVYVWSTSMNYTSTTPTTTTTTGYVGTVPVNAQTTSFTYSDSTLSCQVRAIVDDQNIVRRVEYEGNNGACFAFSDRLKH